MKGQKCAYVWDKYMITDFKITDEKISYETGFFRKKERQIKVPQIPYLMIVGGIAPGSYGGYADWIYKKTKQRVSALVITNRVRLWLLDQTDRYGKSSYIRYVEQRKL